MRNFVIASLLALTSLFTTGATAARQDAHSKKKDRPAVTFEALRNIVIEIQKTAQAARARGNELTELDAVRAMEKGYAARGPAAHSAVATVLLTLNPVVGNYREALRYADVGQSKQPFDRRAGAQKLEGYKPVGAVDAIARAAATDAQVIMINEAHHVPQHRAFTMELLKALRLKGFSYFATETLYEADTRLNERGYPTTQTGYYTAEPVYGDLIRTALKLGYTVVAYEPEFKNADQRERDQARNLVDRVLKKDPKARLLVHAGYSHIDEAGMKTGATTMAQRFKEMTGIDPFTINQTEMTERSAPEYENSVYRYALARGLVSQPSVFKNAQGRLLSLETGTHDVTVFHPRSRYARGRPTWLRLGGSRTLQPLPEDICGTARRCLVRARAANETAEAVPVDQLEVTAGRRAPALMLPAGEFVIDVEDGAGRQIRSFQVKARRL